MCIRDSLYPDVYKNDYLVEVTEDVLETIRAAAVSYTHLDVYKRQV